MNSKHSLERLQDPVGLQALADGRSAHVTDVVPAEAEGVQHSVGLQALRNASYMRCFRHAPAEHGYELNDASAPA